jgi:SLT domain-containing protein/phage-related protein
VADIFVGSVAVGVVPDARGWNDKLRSQLVPSADAIGAEYGRNMGSKIADSMGAAGDKSAGAFGDAFRKRLDAALQALPKARLDGDDSPINAKLDEIRAKMEELKNTSITDPEKATKDLAVIQAELDKISRKSKDIRISFDTAEAKAQLDLLAKDISSKTGGGGGGILSKIPVVGNLLGGGGAAGGASQAAQAAPAAAEGIGPYGWAGIAAGTLAALPFVAQAAGGAITFALGGALAGVGILGAAMTGKLTKDFDALKNGAEGDLKHIGTAFVPVINNILTMALRVFNTLTPVFTKAMGLITGPFKLFADTILKSFTDPAVKQSIDAVATAFGKILNAFRPDIPGIVDSFAQAITRVANAIGKNPKAFADFLNFLFQIIIAVLDAIAYLTLFANYLEAHFVPAVKRAWSDVQSATENIWNSIWNNTVARAIRGGHDLEVVYDHLKNDIISWWHNVQNQTESIWNTIWNNTISRATRGWHDLMTVYGSLRNDIINWWHNVENTTASIWDTIWNNTVSRVVRGWHDVITIYDDLRNDITSWWHNIENVTASIWDTVWDNTVNRAIQGWHSLMGVFSNLKNAIISFFSGALSWLTSAGENVITGLFNGIKNGMADVGNWIKANVVDPVVNAVKHFFGISSPAAVMVPLGASITAGLLKGIFQTGNLAGFVKNVFGGWPQALASLVGKSLVDIAKLPAKALSALGKVGGAIGGFISKLIGGGGSGVQRWAATVAQALALLGLPSSLTSKVLYQMQTESGGNPNAINNWDINAQMGDPSRGLMQVIGATFSAYHVAGTSNNIYDPLANIAAAINYAMHRYGPSLESGGMGIGSGHGYDSGGLLPPGVTLAVNRTGSPEIILTQDQFSRVTRGGDGVAYHAHFDGLTLAAIEQQVQSAFRSMSLTQGHLNRQGRRS